ncbi:hypothetical protein T11_6686 [Trichinella zimbabwensis]|uniref:Uncharacterized protein n=1 Tax=Trichinella zimbabwensis TaxID=268475 RepID=A0A0V1HR17_9BILA|nr:hypothetical protein T11_6686 [Trichinella zimbabwensis]
MKSGSVITRGGTSLLIAVGRELKVDVPMPLNYSFHLDDRRRGLPTGSWKMLPCLQRFTAEDPIVLEEQHP